MPRQCLGQPHECSHLRISSLIPSGFTFVLQAAAQRAESAASKAGSSIASGHTQGLAYLQPLLQKARRQLEVEHVGESLQKAVAAFQSLADLPKLEAAIIAARKKIDVDPAILR